MEEGFSWVRTIDEDGAAMLQQEGYSVLQCQARGTCWIEPFGWLGFVDLACKINHMFSIFLSMKKSVILFCILCFQGDLTSVT